MKKLLLVASMATTLCLGVLSSAPALAASGHPHFIKNATSASLSGSSLTASFKEAGLAAGATENVTLSATETITYECVNGGGMNPSASNKKTFRTRASTSGNFTADQNGNIVGSLTLSPVSAADLGFSCPPGQTVTLVSVTYSNITITDNTSGATISIPGSLTYTNPDAPPVR